MIHNLLFPQLKQAKWAEINLNSFAEITHEFKPDFDFLDPDQMNQWIRRVHEDIGCDFSYGGYLEDRSHICKGESVHLGIDYNVPMGTMVHSVCDGKVVDTIYDPKDFGWGTRLTIQVRPDLYVVYGHLHPNINVQLGQIIKMGDCVGIVGPKDHNGGWYEHLHLQLLRMMRFNWTTLIRNY